jgi:hypothetical protein
LAVAVTLARPPAPMVALPALRLAAAPLPEGVTVNATVPPWTGSPKGLETKTARGLANGVLIAAVWGLSPVTMVIAKPRSWKAPMSMLALGRATPR